MVFRLPVIAPAFKLGAVNLFAVGVGILAGKRVVCPLLGVFQCIKGSLKSEWCVSV